MKRIYADNAATTRLSRKARTEMNRMIDFYPGNPSSSYAEGREAKEKLEECRERCAVCLDCEPNEIIFTSGATEGNAIVLNKPYYNYILTSDIEHPSVTSHVIPEYRHICFKTESNGIVKNSYASRITTYPFIVEIASVMTANNEIGTIQPVKEIAAVCRSKGILFHTDATAAVGHIPVSFREIGADFLTCSAHKFHGPRGIGILIVRNGTDFAPLMTGGRQERNRRAGTENLPGIAGMTAALEESVVNLEKNAESTRILRERLTDGLLAIPRTILNGDGEKRLPGNVNVSFDGIEGESLLTLLDANGISASAGSACHTGTSEPSHVLRAIGRTREQALSALRLTIDETNTDEEIDTIIKVTRESVEYLRKFTPRRTK